ncbi:MAG: cysteine desulfurase [Nanoarchaeota archaeon]|nr:cysteine desulfurase [Nanoarchaeota archaeon]
MKVYLDNAATTRVAQEVVEAIEPFNSQKYGNASSLHSFGQDAKEALENARKLLAKRINAEPDEIVFTSGGSEANNLAIRGMAQINGFGHIITSKIEHPAVLQTCKDLEKQGFEVTYVGVDAQGRVDLKSLESSIKDHTFLVSIMHVNNEVGVIQNIAEIGKVCSDRKVVFHTDAVQSFTKIPIDVKNMNIGLASFSAHKLHGQKGIGMLYVRKGIKLKNQITGGEQEFKIRAGTENVAGVVGFAKASEILTQEDITRMSNLKKHLRQELLNISDTKINGPDDGLCNILNVSFRYIEGESILLRLDAEGVAVSTGSACSSANLAPSHVLIAMGLEHEAAHGSIRFSLSKYTTKEEINYTVKCARTVVIELRKISPLTPRGDKNV